MYATAGAVTQPFCFDMLTNVKYCFGIPPPVPSMEHVMDLKNLAALVTVADTGSVTKAARILHIAQPALSRHVRALETEIGLELFERSRHGMQLTPAGELLTERARRILLELERARAELAPDPTSVTGVVTLGLLESTLTVLGPPVVESIRRRHPGIDLRVVSAYSGHLQLWLEDGTVDLTLLYDLRATSTIAVTPLVHEPLWALAPPGTEIGSRDLTWTRLAEQALVLPNPGHSLRTLIDEAFQALGHAPQSFCQTDSMALQKALVTSAQGWTILPASGAAQDVAARSLEGGPLSEPVVSRTVSLARPRTRRTARAVEAVASEVASVTRRLVHDGDWATAQVIDETTIS